MKNKHFSSHLVESTNLTLEIGELKIEKQERIHLISLFEANTHTIVIKEILDELSPEDKKIFLQNVAAGNHKKTWRHLKNKSEDIENKLYKRIRKAMDVFLKDVKAAKKVK